MGLFTTKNIIILNGIDKSNDLWKTLISNSIVKTRIAMVIKNERMNGNFLKPIKYNFSEMIQERTNKIK